MSKHEAKKIMTGSNIIDQMEILWMVMNEKYYDDNDNKNKNENENENEGTD